MKIQKKEGKGKEVKKNKKEISKIKVKQRLLNFKIEEKKNVECNRNAKMRQK